SGRTKVSAEITGRGGTPAIDGRADIVDLVAAGHAVDPVAVAFRMVAAPGPDTRWTGTVESPRVRSGQVTVGAIARSLAVDASKIEVVRARAQAQSVPVEATGVWNWSGSGRGRATVGPVALAAISGVPPALRLGGTGRGTIDASLDKGTTSATARVDLEQAS